jgi:hypothetical protein
MYLASGIGVDMTKKETPPKELTEEQIREIVREEIRQHKVVAGFLVRVK